MFRKNVLTSARKDGADLDIVFGLGLFDESL
jgi:hypothetical protein